MVTFLVLPSRIQAQAEPCIPPIRPFLPTDPRDIQAYADLLRQDFEAYIQDFGTYLRCLDAERARVFQEGQEVTAEYARFQEVTNARRQAPAD
ncbi:hypothetical protein FHG71_16690 [Rubellimicrobium roseum]|uniref:Uncharacterized protein n=1 Tax=Rubellimicrobium roseum TaxID=687525 RepID=A0A5C4NB05_9RHOB|nr:hypothetical protein [Rubellimicrobium roseum]TNC66433.1 hypothetical protein FHG71_16690 [Rubellimicrobium roseum]